MANQSKTNIWIDGSQAGSTLAELKKSVASLNREIKDLPRNSDAYKKKMMDLKDANGALNQHRNQIKGVSQSYGQAQSSMGGMMKQFAPMAGIAGAISLAIGGVTAAVTSWYVNNKEMEKSLSSLKSLTGASAEDIAFYKEQAMEMGRTSTVSATQTVEAFKLIGSARPDLLKNKEALAEVTAATITLAEAAEMDLAGAADAMAGTMNQFGLGADQSARIINALAAGSKEGAAEITDISLSMEKFGTVAAANNVSVEESVGLIELLSEKNIKGAEAGTQLRNVLLTVSTASALPKSALDALEQYGVNLEKVQDTSIPLEERLRELSKVQGDQVALTKIFGKENVVAGQTILKNVDQFATLTAAVTGTNVAYEQAAINVDNLDGDIKSLGSAWEGLTLSMDGGSSVFRPIVQAGTEMLNWVTDTISAFKQADSIGMENSMLKLGKALTYLNPMWLVFGDSVRDLIDEKIRYNELTSAVMEGMRDEADSSTVLTEALKQNNAALQNKNLTDAQSAKINSENQEIIATLNERYPELTSAMDLNKATSSDLSKLQKDINKNLLEQSINAVKAAEAERILTAIVQNSIAISEQRATESRRWATTNFIADIFADDVKDLEANQEKLKKNLRELPKTMKEVEATIRDINPEFGVAYKENAIMIKEAWTEISRIKKEMKNASGSDKKALDAELSAQQQIIREFNKKNSEIKKGAIAGKKAKEAEASSVVDAAKIQEEIDKKKAAAAEASEKAAKKAADAAKKAQEEYKKLKESLEALIQSTKKYSDDLDYNKKLDAFSDEQQKELFILEKTIKEKYEKDISAAEELAKQKGGIGADAQEQLDTLLIIQEQELLYEKGLINEKYLKEKLATELASQKESNLKYLQAEDSLAKAKVDLQVAAAEAGYNSVADTDVQGKKAAFESLKIALTAQAEYSRTKNLESLMDQLDDGLITHEEYNLRKADLDKTYLDGVKAATNDTWSDIQRAQFDKAEAVIGTIQEVFSAIQEIQAAQTAIRLNEVENEKNVQIQALKDQYDSGAISKDEFERKKLEIEQAADVERKKIEYDAAVRSKQAAKTNAIIGGALAIVQAIAQLGPIAGAIAAVLVATTTAVQIGVIDSQPLPQMEEGGFHNVIGAKDGKMYKAKNLGKHQGGMLPSSPSLVLASENGPEYFVPNHLLQNQHVLNSVRVIEAIRTNQFADGGFTSPVSAVGASISDERLVSLMQANYSMLVSLNGKIPNIRAIIDDGTVDDINIRTAELNALRN